MKLSRRGLFGALGAALAAPMVKAEPEAEKPQEPTADALTGPVEGPRYYYLNGNYVNVMHPPRPWGPKEAPMGKKKKKRPGY